MIRTFGTRPSRDDDRHAAVLEAYAGLMGKAERKIHAWLKAGKEWNAAAYAPLYRDLGLSAAHFRNARDSLNGKLKSVSELAKLRVAELSDKLGHKTRQAASKRGGITKARNRIKVLAPKIAACDQKITALTAKIRTSTAEAARQRLIAEAEFDDRMGCLGVDFNADHVAATLADRFGNPVRTWTIPLVTYGMSPDQTLDAVRKAAAVIARLAVEHDVPAASENLDFTDKKRRLRDAHGPAYARMLSSLAYSSFDAALASASCRSGVGLRRVNPAFTSLIGRVKFAPRYGLSVHAAAALSIARRAMGASERMPAPVGGELKLPLDGGGHVTLPRPARIADRHVWTSWRRLNDGWKTALAARGRTGRKPRSPATDPLPQGLGSAPRRRLRPPSPVGQVRGAPG